MKIITRKRHRDKTEPAAKHTQTRISAAATDGMQGVRSNDGDMLLFHQGWATGIHDRRDVLHFYKRIDDEPTIARSLCGIRRESKILHAPEAGVCIDCNNRLVLRRRLG